MTVLESELGAGVDGICRGLWECGHDFSSLAQNSRFQNRALVQEIIKGASGRLSGCPAVFSWWVAGCFELNQACTHPQSNSIRWLLMPSYLGSGKKVIF